ncbi:MAG: hypothetical protein FWD12_06450 [Alphaproteobacteria bacterium]|nr:hypothetical protein [Alphaproteobacteria bacterium]
MQVPAVAHHADLGLSLEPRRGVGGLAQFGPQADDLGALAFDFGGGFCAVPVWPLDAVAGPVSI